jgi:hypothetical protein
MSVLTNYANPNHAAHRSFYVVSPYGVDVQKVAGTEVVRRMRNVLHANHGKDTRDVHWIAQCSLQKIYRYGSYVDAVEMLRAGWCSYAWHPEMSI